MSKKNILIFSTALIVVLLDQLIKFLIRKNFQLGQPVPLIKNILNITYLTNTGSAFSLFQNLNFIFIIFSSVVVVAIFYIIAKVKENQRLMQFAFGLLLGGTIGNLTDRLIYGAVTDFIDFRIWPVFNIADSAVSVSIILFIILLWEK